MNIVPPKEIEKEWANYEKLKDSGLRKQANKALLTVIEEIQNGNKHRMKEFLLSLFDDALTKFSETRIQQPLFVKCILPILVQGLKAGLAREITYIVRANECGFGDEIFKELGELSNEELLKSALASEPGNIEAINLLANEYVSILDFGAHHLPSGLVIELDYAKRVISESAAFILKHRDNIHENIIKEHQYYSSLYTDYQKWKAEEKNLDFAGWCSKNKLEYSWVTAVYYEK
ncbi:hypothetical protein [Pseudoalteromonas ardens]|uniref:Uncharacterized protein n=1 Tax=Pseudoalteromonas rubra TaxID=43658 RepID=A0A0L0EPM2_9GAMM|nr:hypothetical protein [Pseudoalteromonas sp. R96]KNC66325.1 hypothetical protein AC626_17700 [Pseudoalteromonas rubra]MDK1312794.1 hypothetical protein [Pseudoalteromonas sp. R96]